MAQELETVRVAQPSADNPNDYALINKSDFNPELHTLWSGPKPIASTKTTKATSTAS